MRLKTEAVIVPDVPHRITGHPAKIHPFIAETLIEDYTSTGDLVLDPFAGIGTIPEAAACLGRESLGVEIEKQFVEAAAARGVCLAHGDSSVFDFPEVDCVITSPPYGEAIGRAGDREIGKTIEAKRRYEIKRFGSSISDHSHYGMTPGNLGSLPLKRKAAPCFVSQFPLIAANVIQSVKPGGLIVWVVKDQRLGRRSLGSMDIPAFMRSTSEALGCVYVERRIFILPERLYTLWQRVNAKRWGHPIPNVEHVIVVRRTP